MNSPVPGMLCDVGSSGSIEDLAVHHTGGCSRYSVVCLLAGYCPVKSSSVQLSSSPSPPSPIITTIIAFIKIIVITAIVTIFTVFPITNILIAITTFIIIITNITTMVTIIIIITDDGAFK
ncbi:hypothetical protein STEG23_029519 [Scotinomys teguina]